MSINGQGHFLTLAKGQLQIIVKLNFLSNRLTNQSHILYVVSFKGGETKIYISGQGLMTKMAAMAINSKNL